MSRRGKKLKRIPNRKKRHDLLESSYEMSEDVSVLFSTSNSLTPSFNPTILDFMSSDSQIIFEDNNNYGKKELPDCIDILDENIKSSFSNEADLYTSLLSVTDDVTIVSRTEDRTMFVQENKSNEAVQSQGIGSNVNNKSERCNLCDKTEGQRFHSCKRCKDGYGLKQIRTECPKPIHRRIEKCYDRTIYHTNRDPRCKKIKYKYCKCKLHVPVGLCLFGFLLVVIGTGMFGGCWVYLAFASVSICNRSAYLHFFWYYIYGTTIFMFIFTIIVIILVANSMSKNSSCSMLKNPGTGKNCSIIILFIIVAQCFVWMFLFAVAFYIGTEMFLLENNSKALCGVIDMTLNYTNIIVGDQQYSKKTLILIFISVLGALTVLLGLILIIIGVSMNYQKMKSAVNNELKDVQIPYIK